MMTQKWRDSGERFMGIKLVECLDWRAENRPAELLKVVEKLAEAGVSLEAFWAYISHENEPKIAAIARKTPKLRVALQEIGIQPTATQCFCVTGKDKAGTLVKIFQALADANINISCLDALASGGNYLATFWVSDADLEKAKKILKAR